MTPTHEEKLKAVIEAQQNGIPWLETDQFEIDNCGDVKMGKTNLGSVLMYLLDTAGCKAAYKSDQPVCWCPECGGVVKFTHPPHAWQECAIKILEAWNSGEGNSWQSALDCAFSLLPKQ